MTKRCALALSICLAAPGSALLAQEGRPLPTRVVPDTLAAVMDTLLSDAVVREGLPRDFVVILVPVPASLPIAANVSFSVEPEDGIHVLGSRRGTVIYGESRRVVVTVGVPADAIAGELHAATVVFVVPGQAAARVPVLVEVLSVRSVAIIAPARVTGLRPGERFNLSMRVRNRGNVTDTVQVAVDAPQGWTVRDAVESLVVVAPGGDADHVVAIDIPAQVATGDFFAKVMLLQSGKIASEALVTMEVGSRIIRDNAPAGPVLTSGFSMASVSGGSTVGALHIKATGPLTAFYNIDARASIAPDNLPAAAVRGLSRVGAYAMSPYVTVWSPTSRFAAGNVLGSFGDLSGVNASGRGLSASMERGSTNIEVVAAQPLGFSGTDNKGLVLGGRYDRPAFGLDFGASASMLRSAFDPDQRLTSLALEAASDALPFARLSGGLAYRSYQDGSGIGALFGAHHHTQTRDIELRAVHAPGGGRAFARTRDEFSLVATQSLNERTQVGGSAYFAGDDNRAFNDVTTNTLMLFQQYRWRPLTTFRLEARSTTFDARSGEIGFGNGEQTLIGSANSSSGSFFYSVQAAIASISRTVKSPDLGTIDARGPRHSIRTVGGLSLTNGVLQGEVAYERADARAGYLPTQLTIGGSVDRFRVAVMTQPIYLHASAMRYDWGATREGMTIVRAFASIPLNHDIELVAGSERNPLYRTRDGKGDWTFSLRVDKRVSLPRLTYGAIAGIVYQDANGNGIRDNGERGIGGVAVRMGENRTVSGDDGRYYFWTGPRAQPSLDPASLPSGLIAGISRGRGESGRFELPASPTASVEVTMEFAAGPFGTTPDVDISTLPVIARDKNGREWTARRIAPRVAQFESLPVGEYTLDFDFSAIPEPLRVEKAITFRAQAGHSLRVTAELAGRPLRFRRDGGDTTPSGQR